MQFTAGFKSSPSMVERPFQLVAVQRQLQANHGQTLSMPKSLLVHVKHQSHPRGGQLAIRISHGLPRFAPSACRHPASSPCRSKLISCLSTSKRPTKLFSRHLARPSSGGRIWWCTNNQEAPCPMARWTAGTAPANAQRSSLPNKAVAQDGFERIPLGSCQKGACDQIGTWELSFQPASGSCESLIPAAIDGYGRRLSTTRAAKNCPRPAKCHGSQLTAGS